MENKNIADKLIPGDPNVYTFLRIITGLIILVRSFNFIFVIANLRSMIERADIAAFTANSSALSMIVACLNIACGLFITVGFISRVSAIIQLPILFVATFLINIKHLGDNAFEFILSFITLCLVIIVAYKGSGTFSADEYFRKGAAIDKRGENLV
jgi:putative oxidoreductase